MLVSGDGTVVKIDTYKEICNEEFNSVDWGKVVVLETSSLSNFGENMMFHNLKHLILTLDNPCFSIHWANYYKFPNLKTLKLPFYQTCCEIYLAQFVQKIIKENAYPWLLYCIKTCYPKLDKRLVKKICQYLLYTCKNDWLLCE